MPVGVDTYSYHRLLGWPRPGETAPVGQLADGGLAAIAEARRLGLDVLSMETCFFDGPTAVDAGAFVAAAGDVELMLSWGHPNGLAFGQDSAAVDDLLAWLDVAAELRSTTIRIVVGGPSLRLAEPVEHQIARTVEPLRLVTARAAELGLHVAIENHADLTARELVDLIERVGAPNLGVCFDTANAIRVGDDVVEAAGVVAPHLRVVHLKDVESPAGVTDPVAGPCSLPYGQGVIPLDEVLDALAAPIAGGVPVCVEIAQLRHGDDEFELVESGVRWLRSRGF